MAPLVLRDGVAKVCIIMQARLGQALISEDRKAQALSVYVLANQLAHVGCVELMDKTLPGILFSHIEDSWEAWLYTHMHDTWVAYFGTRISACFNPAIGSTYRDTLLTALKQMKETIPSERLAYRTHGDLDRFLGSSITSIGKFMTAVGEFLGHCDGLDEPLPDEDGNLTRELNESGLYAWVDVVRHDLGNLFDDQGQWKSFQQFLDLNRHIERVLWQFTVFPWRNEEGQVRVEIPLWSDAIELFKRT